MFTYEYCVNISVTRIKLFPKIIMVLSGDIYSVGLT